MADLEKSKQNLPAFDYSGMDAQTVATLRSAEDMIRHACKDYVLKVADAVAMAHDELVHQVDEHNNQYSEKTFNLWCESQGIGKTTAYKLLQVSSLLESSTPNEQKILESAPASLLYAAAKPSAPDELVAKVKDGSITSSKEYQDALAQIKSLQTQNSSLLHSYETERGRADSTEKRVTGLQASYDAAHKNEEYTIERAKKLEQEKAETEKQLEGARQAMQAAKLRGDKLKTENEDLRARPIEVAVDPDEINRRAEAKAEELTADLRRQLEEAKKPPTSDNGESDENRCYDQVIHANRLISSSWGLAKEFYKHLPSEGADSLKHIAADMIGRSLEQIKEDLKCL